MSGLSEQFSRRALLSSLFVCGAPVDPNGSHHPPSACHYSDASHSCSSANLKKHQSLSGLSAYGQVFF